MAADEGIVQFSEWGVRDTSLDKTFYDEEGFIKTFEVTDKSEYKAFFERHGFVVVRCLTSERCQASRDDMWNYLETGGWLPPRFRRADGYPKRTDPSTWDRWPEMANEGILGSASVWSAQAFEVRQNPNIHSVWATLLDDDKLIVNIDRYGLFRPTVGPSFKSQWATRANIHLDMSPEDYFTSLSSQSSKEMLASLNYFRANDFIVENNEVGVLADKELHVQGLINLADNRDEDGGFWLVPGFHHFLHRHYQLNKSLWRRCGPSRFNVLPSEQTALLKPIRITPREGCLVLWNQLVAHGSSPNRSSNPRYAQFFKMFRASTLTPERALARRIIVEEKLAEINFVPTPLGRQLFGLDLPSESTSESTSEVTSST